MVALSYPVPVNEAERLAALRELDILDTAPEPAYDDIVKLAAAICRTPIAIINFIDEDRQWGKALVGLEDSEAPRDASFCARTILSEDGTMVVGDTLEDMLWVDNPMVTGDPNLRFYAGAAIVDEEGRALGSVCVADRLPRGLDDEQLDALKVLARQTAAMLDLRRHRARLADANEELHRLALADPLTGLPNRTLLFDRLQQALERLPRTGGSVGIAFCDLDGFKQINDTHGHDVGDEMLRLVAERLKSAARTVDTVARVAGDEFVVVCPDLKAEGDMQVVASRLEAVVGEPAQLGGVKVAPQLSIGTVVANSSDKPDELLRAADMAMYETKRARSSR